MSANFVDFGNFGVLDIRSESESERLSDPIGTTKSRSRPRRADDNRRRQERKINTEQISGANEKESRERRSRRSRPKELHELLPSTPFSEMDFDFSEVGWDEDDNITDSDFGGEQSSLFSSNDHDNTVIRSDNQLGNHATNHKKSTTSSTRNSMLNRSRSNNDLMKSSSRKSSMKKSRSNSDLNKPSSNVRSCSRGGGETGGLSRSNYSQSRNNLALNRSDHYTGKRHSKRNRSTSSRQTTRSQISNSSQAPRREGLRQEKQKSERNLSGTRSSDPKESSRREIYRRQKSERIGTTSRREYSRSKSNRSLPSSSSTRNIKGDRDNRGVRSATETQIQPQTNNRSIDEKGCGSTSIARKRLEMRNRKQLSSRKITTDALLSGRMNRSMPNLASMERQGKVPEGEGETGTTPGQNFQYQTRPAPSARPRILGTAKSRSTRNLRSRLTTANTTTELGKSSSMRNIMITSRATSRRNIQKPAKNNNVIANSTSNTEEDDNKGPDLADIVPSESQEGTKEEDKLQQPKVLNKLFTALTATPGPPSRTKSQGDASKSNVDPANARINLNDTPSTITVSSQSDTTDSNEEDEDAPYIEIPTNMLDDDVSVLSFDEAAEDSCHDDQDSTAGTVGSVKSSTMLGRKIAADKEVAASKISTASSMASRTRERVKAMVNNILSTAERIGSGPPGLLFNRFNDDDNSEEEELLFL